MRTDTEYVIFLFLVAMPMNLTLLLPGCLNKIVFAHLSSSLCECGRFPSELRKGL